LKSISVERRIIKENKGKDEKEKQILVEEKETNKERLTQKIRKKKKITLKKM
jgi:hypothetical protein